MPRCRQRPLDTLLLHSGFTPCAWSAPVVSAPCTCPCLAGSSLCQGCLTLEELGMLRLASLGWQPGEKIPLCGCPVEKTPGDGGHTKETARVLRAAGSDLVVWMEKST